MPDTDLSLWITAVTDEAVKKQTPRKLRTYILTPFAPSLCTVNGETFF